MSEYDQGRTLDGTYEAAPEIRSVGEDEEFDPDDWIPGEILASVSYVCVPLQRFVHKDDPSREVVLQLIKTEDQKVYRQHIPIGFVHALALQVAGSIFGFFLPKSPTLADKLVKSMNLAKDHLIFGIEVNDGTAKPVVIEIPTKPPPTPEPQITLN